MSAFSSARIRAGSTRQPPHAIQPRGRAPAPPVLQRASSCPCGGTCPRCAAAGAALGGLRISEPGDAHEREADAIAAQVAGARSATSVAEQAGPRIQRAPSNRGAAARPATGGLPGSSGKALDAATRAFMEPRFGADFGEVRIHDDAAAASSAAELDARAYTVGSDIVFGVDQYQPGSAAGRHLLAHELAHVVQQRAGAPWQIQRAPAFGSMYKSGDGTVRSHLGVEYDAYKGALGATQGSSASPGARHRLKDPFLPVTRAELLEIFTQLAQDLADGKITDKTVDDYVARLNAGFETFLIDTVEAQASFLANAWHESSQFRYMTETEGAHRQNPNPPYQQDPKNVNVAKGYLDCAARRSAAVKAGRKPDPQDEKVCPNVINYERGGSINYNDDWNESFIGRGPIQVTHRHYYVQVLAVMEHRADELEAADPDSPEAKSLREAVKQISADPRQAANPQYAFLFSAAFMKMADDKGVRGDVKASRGQVTSWMGQQPAAAQADKDQAYARAHAVLIRKWEVQVSQYGYGVADDPINSGALGPGDASAGVRPGPVRSTTIRPR
ncbi:MAG: eCIS core domain-containing protein [Caldimonas sp.]